VLPRWKLDDIAWERLDPRAVSAPLLAAVKTAALVEANSADYVTYLHKVFAEDPVFMAAATHWGLEEAQHGAALGRWAETVDPQFDFAASLKRFRDGYQIPLDASRSVRGSAAGELLARCVVESGTCSYYSAVRDHTSEPVLKQICHRIAQDEARHYQLFRTHYQHYAEQSPMSFWTRLKIALGRVGETGDDELAFAYYSANLATLRDGPAYDRRVCGRTYRRITASMYELAHVRTVVHMIANAVGVHPGRWLIRSGARAGWWWLRGIGILHLPHAAD